MNAQTLIASQTAVKTIALNAGVGVIRSLKLMATLMQPCLDSEYTSAPYVLY